MLMIASFYPTTKGPRLGAQRQVVLLLQPITAVLLLHRIMALLLPPLTMAPLLPPLIMALPLPPLIMEPLLLQPTMALPLPPPTTVLPLRLPIMELPLRPPITVLLPPLPLVLLRLRGPALMADVAQILGVQHVTPLGRMEVAVHSMVIAVVLPTIVEKGARVDAIQVLPAHRIMAVLLLPLPQVPLRLRGLDPMADAV